MNLAPIPVTLINGASRRQGWRAALLDDSGRAAWRCACLLHNSPEAARACGVNILNKRGSGFYAGRADMNDYYLPVPYTNEARLALVQSRMSVIPKTAGDALSALNGYFDAIMNEVEASAEVEREHSINAGTVDTFIDAAEFIKTVWASVKEVRELAEMTILTGSWLIGREANKAEARGRLAVGTRGNFVGRDSSGRAAVAQPETNVAKLAELFGNRTRGTRCRFIANRPLVVTQDKVRWFHRREDDATLYGVLQAIKADESAEHRLDSMTTPPSDDFELRIGDCRVMLADVPDNSIPLIMTDPPYGNEAEPLYEWLAAFAARVLIPGGSLICYTGTARLPRDHRIFSEHLTFLWEPIMLHDAAQKMFNPGVRANHKKILWYGKEYRRVNAKGKRSIVPDVVQSTRDKSSHEWGQGDAGVRQWIHHLTEPGEKVVDPFAGTAEWGLITCEEGRGWLGCDLVEGGTTTIEADEFILEGETVDDPLPD